MPLHKADCTETVQTSELCGYVQSLALPKVERAEIREAAKGLSGDSATGAVGQTFEAEKIFTPLVTLTRDTVNATEGVEVVVDGAEGAGDATIGGDGGQAGVGGGDVDGGDGGDVSEV